MELRQLAYYKSIVEHGSINAAAKDLHMSQPPLSYAVAQLENELSVKLFERSAKGIRLTPAGKVFYLHSQDILARANSAMQAASGLSATRKRYWQARPSSRQRERSIQDISDVCGKTFRLKVFQMRKRTCWGTEASGSFLSRDIPQA